MKPYLLTVVLISAALLSGQCLSREEKSTRPDQARAPSIDGAWTVVYAEMDGKKLDEKHMTQVVIRNNVLSCQQDGKERSWQLRLQPGQIVIATERSGHGSAEKQTERRETAAGGRERPAVESSSIRQGVYIAAREYLCLELHQASSTREGTRATTAGEGRLPPTDPAEKGASADRPAPHSAFILILKRNSGTVEPGR